MSGATTSWGLRGQERDSCSFYGKGKQQETSSYTHRLKMAIIVNTNMEQVETGAEEGM